MSLQVKKILALNDVVASATSNSIFVGNYEKVGILLRRTLHTSGSSAFSFLGGFGENGSDTGVSLYPLNTVLDNVTNSNVQGLTRVAGKTLSSATDAFLWLSPETPITHLQIAVVRTTDGTSRAEVYGFEGINE